MLIRSQPNLLEKIRYSYRYRKFISSYNQMQSLSEEESVLLAKLKHEGFLVLENFIPIDKLSKMRDEFQNTLELLKFKEPCLGQSLIDASKHEDLIQNHFYGSDNDFFNRGITFCRSDVNSLQEAIEKYNPSTLTAYMLEYSRLYQSVWLNEKLLRIVAAYMGMVPKLTEAYVRRNFPSNYKVMNHYWHRDLNHKHYLLKVFIFLSDCAIDNGPHEFISGTHNDFNMLNGRRYYDDLEVDDVYPKNSKERIISTVKAGTVIIEDTRGLHRAQMPVTGKRDLGYAVFMPDANAANFKINREDFSRLTSFQKLFISNPTVV